MEKLVLDERLAAAAELVPAGSSLLDVGTDHGYLPAKLLLDDKIPFAGASDINADPLSKAVATAEKYGVSDKMKFYLSNGLDEVPDIENYTSISICGMGGELISDIISRSDYIRKNNIPLILQPMSSVEEMSRYLSSEGFAITDERISYAAGKVYRVILVSYIGEKYELSDTEHMLGRINIERGNTQKNFALLLRKNILKYKRIIDGKKKGSVDHGADVAILDELIKIAKQEGVEYEDL